VPAAIACAIVAVQFAIFQVGNSQDVGLELYLLSFMLSSLALLRHYSIGRAIGQRRKAKR
jgi:hypothetical protein